MGADRSAGRPDRAGATYHPVDFIADDVERDIWVTMSDWDKLQDAPIDASFWALDKRDGRIGLDGTYWTVKGRRKDIFRFVYRWSTGGAIWRLGWVFFDLADLAPIGLH